MSKVKPVKNKNIFNILNLHKINKRPASKILLPRSLELHQKSEKRVRVEIEKITC